MKSHRRGTTLRITLTCALIPLSLTLLVPAHASGLGRTPASNGPIYIGVILSLTGVNVGASSDQKAGAALALRQVNARGGINGQSLKLVLADDHSTDAGGIAALHKLAASRHITAIIGPGGSTEVLAMTPLMKRARIPVIIGGTALKTTRVGNPWVFRTRPNNSYLARAMATFTVSTLHQSRIAVLYTENSTGSDIHSLLRPDLEALGIVPVADLTYPTPATDLTAQVLAIKKSGATGLIITGQSPLDFLLLARQTRQVGLHLTWMGNPNLAGAAGLPGGEILHGTYAVTDYVPAQSPEALAFSRAFKAAFHRQPQFAAAYSYDGMQILARAIRKMGTNHRAIRRGILAIHGYRGAQGTYKFDRHGDGLHQCTVVQNVNGRLRVIKVLSF